MREEAVAMRTGIRWLVVAAVCAAALVGGCATSQPTTERFVRYTTLKDGSRAAMLTRIERGDPTEIASVKIADLKAGDLVVVEDVGKDWDQPQWKPSMAVLSRATTR
jgi:uncharacterized membrane protein YhhN